MVDNAINIHSQLQKDCLVIGKFPLCYLLLMKDANYPWFILVPDREDLTEIYQLDDSEQKQLISESSTLARIISKQYKADKINIAALGNLVPQLHIHHIVRHTTDAAWPAPVWGKLPAKPYTNVELEQVITSLKQGLNSGFDYFIQLNTD